MVAGSVVAVVGALVDAFVFVDNFVVTGVVLDCVVDDLVVGGTLVVDVSHSTLAAQSQYFNCELKSNPLGHLLT